MSPSLSPVPASAPATRPNPASAAPPRIALLLKLDTLGDFVLFAPALRELRAAWPATRLCVVLRPAYLDLAAILAPGVEFVPTSLDPFAQGPDGDPAELARLRKLVTDLAPDLVAAATGRRNWLEAALAAVAPAARRVALGTDTHDEHFSTQLRVALGLDATQVFPEQISVAADEPDAQRNLRLAAALLHRIVGPSSSPAPAPAAPPLPSAAVTAARNYLSSHGLSPKRYVICAAAGFANVRLKTWPAERFAAVLRHLHAKHGLPALLVGHESERAYLEPLLASLSPARRSSAALSSGLSTSLASPSAPSSPSAPPPPPSALWLGRENSLPTLAALLADSTLFLGNDTGAMHLAAALDVPVVAIFGGGTWPRFTPVARCGVALVQPLPCFGCGWDCAFTSSAPTSDLPPSVSHASSVAPCLSGVTFADAIAALDEVLANPDAPFSIQHIERLHADAFNLVGAASTRYRALRSEHLARQHKLEELTALDREKDDAILEKESEIDALKAAANTKDAEIASLKTVCDERERLILQQDGHIKHFQNAVADLEARLTAAHDDKARFQHALAQLPRDTAKAAETLANQSVHIRNIEALVVLRDREIAALKTTLAERDASLAAYASPHASTHAALEQAKHYGRLLAEKEAVLQTLSRACAERETVITRLAAESTDSTSLLHRLSLATSAYFREKLWRPFDTWLFSRVVEKYWMQIGVLRHHDPKPLVWDSVPVARLPVDRLPQLALVTPSYGQEKFVERTMLSILDQHYPRLLYAVQDGGSKDASPAIIARHAARLRHWESVRDHGQADAIRRGFAHLTPDLAPTDLMAWLNSDDLIGPGVLRYVAEYFATHPDVDVLYGHRIIIDENDGDVGRWIMPRHDPHVLEWIDYVPQETLFWRKRAWDLAGGIDPSFQFALDWDLLARFQQAGCRMVRVPYCLGAFRVHSEQKTSQAIHTIGADEMKRIRTRFHGERQDDWATIDRYARRTRFRGALVARLLSLGLRW